MIHDHEMNHGHLGLGQVLRKVGDHNAIILNAARIEQNGSNEEMEARLQYFEAGAS